MKLYDDSWKEKPCKEWQGPKMAGYGAKWFKIDGKFIKKKIHRHTIEQFLGRKLSPHEFVCHKCDNPACKELADMFNISISHTRSIILKVKWKHI